MLQAFTQWLSTTELSIALAQAMWVVPTFQIVHILAITIVMSSAVMTDLRLLGINGRTQALPDVAERFLPWIWRAVVVLLLTGMVLIIVEPGRELLSIVFWIKMALLSCALLLTAVIQKLVRAPSSLLERSQFSAGVLAALSLALWTATLSAGRWIAYLPHG